MRHCFLCSARSLVHASEAMLPPQMHVGPLHGWWCHDLQSVHQYRCGRSCPACCRCVQQLCDEVRAEAPTDQHVLHTMGMVYRGGDCMSRLTAAYAAASAKEPSDLGLLTAVFGGYVRCAERFGSRDSETARRRTASTQKGNHQP